VSTIELLYEPASEDRLAAETVTLSLHANGDLVLRMRSPGGDQ
jgi:hypothetical protein